MYGAALMAPENKEEAICCRSLKLFTGKTYLSVSYKVFFVIWFAAVGFCIFAPYGDLSGGARAEDRAVYENDSGNEPVPAIESGHKDRVYLFFIEPDGRYLTSEIRNIEHPGNIFTFCRMMMEALIDGPGRRSAEGRAGSLIPVLDPETQLLGVYIDDAKTAYVDLSKKTARSYPGGIRMELLSVYSIANTLVVNIDGIDRVKLLLDGNEAKTFAGHIDIGYPVKANMLLVR